LSPWQSRNGTPQSPNLRAITLLCSHKISWLEISSRWWWLQTLKPQHTSCPYSALLTLFSSFCHNLACCYCSLFILFVSFAFYHNIYTWRVGAVGIRFTTTFPALRTLPDAKRNSIYWIN
jgi:hypothetical protein